jgi:hypothetical protein
MKIKLLFGLVLLFIAPLAFTPANAIAQAAEGPAQATMPQQDRTSNTNQQTGQSVEATVTGVDRPDECLRIRQEASSSSEIIGCAKMDEKLQLSGNYSRDGRWAELADKGWVFAAQIDAPNKPKVQSQARRSYESYDTEDDFYTMGSDSSLWRAPAGSYYGTDTGVVYGSSYSYGPTVTSESSLWREPVSSYYETDTGVVYGGPYSYGPSFGFGPGPGPVRRHHGRR